MDDDADENGDEDEDESDRGSDSDAESQDENDDAIDSDSTNDNTSSVGDAGSAVSDDGEDASIDSSLDASIDDDSAPPDCGDVGQSCCPGDVCSDGGCCVGDQCVADGDSCGETGGRCSSGACESCGASEQACCDGNCQEALGCVENLLTGEPQCAPCGGAEEPCCRGLNCSDGVCVGTGVLGVSICQVDCGAAGQKCCPRGIAGILGAPLGACQEGISCDEGTCVGDAPDSSEPEPDGESDGTMIVVRARGTTGSEHINLRIDSAVIADWTLSTDFEEYTQTTSASGNVIVEFDNDQGASDDVQIDFIEVNGQTRQAEDQLTNTAAFANGQCGAGALTEWMHCNGVIDFGELN